MTKLDDILSEFLDDIVEDWSAIRGVDKARETATKSYKSLMLELVGKDEAIKPAKRPEVKVQNLYRKDRNMYRQTLREKVKAL